MRRFAPVAVIAVLATVLGLVIGSGHSAGREHLVDRYVHAWARGDYATMYSLLDTASQRALTPGTLASEYQHAAATATLTGMTFGHARASGNAIVVAVRSQTHVFGTIAAPLRVTVAGDGSAARVIWNPRLLFAGLRDGEQLSRTSRLPLRAALLARDGSVLASGAPDAGGQRRSALGSAATAITGVLGPIPADQAAALTAAGYPPTARVGLNGLERAFEQRLSGTIGGTLQAGMRLLASRAAQASAPVRTTISASLQNAAVNALGGRLGAIVMLRPRTGEILALAGIPLSGLQPPGSTFKMITTTAALESHVASARSSFPFQSSATLSGVTLQNANGETCGGTLIDAFATSCNSVFAPLGAKVGASRLVAAARRFGFDEPTGITGAATSTIPDPASIGDDLAVGSSAIGQGEVQATALEMAIVASTIGMGGRRPRPTLEAGVLRPGVRATTPSIARTVGQMMLAVVRRGTGTAAAIPGVAVAGKTGTAELKQTAQNCTASNGQSTSGSSQSCSSTQNNPANTDAWFAAYAPAGHPRLALAVLLVADGAGGTTAAPVAHDLFVTGLHTHF